MLAECLFREETFPTFNDFAEKTDDFLVFHAYVVLTGLLRYKLLAAVAAFKVTSLIDGLFVRGFMPAQCFWFFEGPCAIGTDVGGGVALFMSL